MTNTEVTLTDLHPYTEYYIRVVAQNKNGPGTPTEEQPVRTYSASKFLCTMLIKLGCADRNRTKGHYLNLGKSRLYISSPQLARQVQVNSLTYLIWATLFICEYI